MIPTAAYSNKNSIKFITTNTQNIQTYLFFIQVRLRNVLQLPFYAQQIILLHPFTKKKKLSQECQKYAEQRWRRHRL